MKMRFLPDKPIENWTQDQLKLGKFVDQLRTAIENTETPFVFGVLGDWGTGKTSALNLLKDSFITKKGDRTYFIPIWFNAWFYENEANIVYPLLYAIKKDYQQRLKGIDEAKKLGDGLLKVVAASTLALTDVGLRVVSKHFIGDAMKLSDIQEQVKDVLENPGEVEKVLSSWADQVSILSNAYQSLIDSYAAELAATLKDVSQDDIRFVILIDDLDRCLPQTAVTILESIKNFLSANRCVYVFGLNPKVVYQGIKVKYQGLDIDGREYLEKILNYSFYVPEPSVDDVYSFAIKSLEGLLPESERAPYQDYFVTFGQVLKECRFNNPRKEKRIFNHYLLFIEKNESELSKYYMDNIVKLIILGEYFPNIFVALQNDDSRREIAKIGGAGFGMKDFENIYGIPFGNSYQQLVKMRNLVIMNENATEQKQRFSAHYQAVNALLT
jgi:hypothetical protein